MAEPERTTEQQGAILNVLPHPVCLFDRQGRVLFVNQAWTRFCGRPGIAELNRGWLDHLNEQDQARWEALWSAPIPPQSAQLEWRWLNGDAPANWVQFTLAPLPPELAPAHFLGTLHDFTQQRAAEEAARNRAAQVQLLANGVPVLIAHFSADDFTCLLANKAYALNWGVDERKIVGMKVPEIIGAEGWRQIEPYVQRALKGETVSYERAIKVASGERVIEVMLIPNRDAEGHIISAFVMINDITRHRQAEQAIRDSEERLKKFTEATNEGILFHDLGTVIDCNDAMARMIGSSREALIGVNMFQFVAPESVDTITAAVKAGLEKTYEATILRNDGSRIAVEITGKQLVFEGVVHRMTVIRDITDRKEAEARIQFLAHHDTLTQLPNRLMMMDRLEHMLAVAKRHAKMVGVLFIDLDNFKTVNDSLGHHAGDELLKRVASRIQSCLRAADMVARLGGDEFLVVVSDLALAEDVVPVAEKLLEAVAESFSIEGHIIQVSPSIGISVFPRDGQDRDALIKNADAAMYLAKENGRNNFQFYTAQLNKGAFEALAMESGIRRAIEQVQFLVHYQPEISLSTGEITGVEALIRWQHPSLGILGPDKFISVAEHRGLIMPIGKWVLNEAARQNAAWQRQGLLTVPMAVNLSPLQFRQPQMVDLVARALADAGLGGEFLELEITENLLMQDTQQVMRTLNELKRLKVRLTVDDFGAGYSSLSYLKRFPIDKLKIDRSFVRNLPGSIEDVAITNAMISLARSLGMRVLAEGVEREPQAEFLRTQKCDEIQGYLVAAPMSAVDFEAWVASYSPASLVTQR